jgi:asparagine synthase (glutamine-hydrolysing)
MCGIAGKTSDVSPMIARMQHRGPDDNGTAYLPGFEFGHTRLAVLDPEHGHQPMRIGGTTIVHNGEVYNFKDIDVGPCTTGTDTEVILRAFLKWGRDCVHKFSGQWAFAIHHNNKVFVSRDRYGIKPLYYTERPFAFSSVANALPNDGIDYHALNYYLWQKYAPVGRTIYKDVYELRPGWCMECDLKTGAIEKWKWYDLEKHVTGGHTDISLLGTLLQRSVKDRLVSDVPLGCFLSGGIDSSLIAKYARRDTYSMGFLDDSYSELPQAKETALAIGEKNLTGICGMDDDLVQAALDKLDQPLGDSSYIPTFALCGLAKQDVDVCLSGDGADEVFGGYDHYKAHRIVNRIPRCLASFANKCLSGVVVGDSKVPSILKAKKFFNTISYIDNPDYQTHHVMHYDWMAQCSGKELDGLLNGRRFSLRPQEPQGYHYSTAAQITDVQNYLANDILRKVDLASMAHGLEVRVPYLDHSIVHFGLNLSPRLRANKKLLREVAVKSMPHLRRRKKAGFTAPISKWIKNSQMAKDLLLGPTELFSREYVRAMYQSHVVGAKNNARSLWSVMVARYVLEERSN